jgi:hypothetical protein
MEKLTLPEGHVSPCVKLFLEWLLCAIDEPVDEAARKASLKKDQVGSSLGSESAGYLL